MMRPTELVLTGLKIPINWSDGNGKTQEQCAFCGYEIPVGQARYPYRPAASFSDWQYLAVNSGRLCAACVRFTENEFLTNIAQCVVSLDGAWSLRKDDEIAAFLLEPPTPPFVAVWNDTQKAHLVWRATVTRDPNFLHVQFGRAHMTIDRTLLAKAISWTQELTGLLIADGARGLDSKRHPFASLDRKRRNAQHGRLRDDAIELASRVPLAAELVTNLDNLGEGELWALAILAKRAETTPMRTPIPYPFPTRQKADNI
jgi:CRISPR type IV-associated protein Csf1